MKRGSLRTHNPPMTLFALDIPTVYLLTGVGSFAGSAILWWLRGDHRGGGPAMALFASSIALLGLGFLTFAIRGHLAPWIPAALGYGAFGIACVLVWLASAYLLGTTPHPRVAGAAVALYLLVFAGLHQPTATQAMARIALSSVFIGVFLVLSVREAQRSRWLASLRSVQLLRVLLIGYASMIALRALLFATEGIALRANGLADPDNWRLLFAIVFASMPFAITVSVLGISNAQLGARLRHLASTDDLTGLVSRRLLEESGARLLARGHEIGCIALMMIDLDNFKSINDRHGHVVGDQLLQHVASVLRHTLRSDSLIVRYGGDEFCALVPVPGEAAAFVVAERLRAAMEAAPLRLGDRRIATTMSIGVAVCRAGSTLAQMLDVADRRAYRAKAQGRNRVVAEDELAAA